MDPAAAPNEPLHRPAAAVVTRWGYSIPLVDPRRTLIADAALRVIAALGIRGLTHLAVDTEAGLPKGSTSYYCRKRVDLLRLTLQRLFDLDEVDMEAVKGELSSGGPHTVEQIARTVAEVLHMWLSDAHRGRTLARFELFLAVSHEPELRELNGKHMVGFVELSLAVAAAAQPPIPAEHAAATLMMADGLMLAVVRQGLPTPSVDDITTLILSVISGPAIRDTADRPPALDPERVHGGASGESGRD